MPLLSFSGETYEGPFWKQILNGKKTQTCRKPRKRPIKSGDSLSLYWKVRIPNAKKEIHYIGKATCVKVERKKYREFAFDDKFALKDGFHDSRELREWFGDPVVYGDEEYDVITFA